MFRPSLTKFIAYLFLLSCTGLCAGAAIESPVPIAWTATKGSQQLLILPEHPPETDGDPLPARVQRLEPYLRRSKLVLTDLMTYSGTTLQFKCADEVSAKIGDLGERLSAFQRWRRVTDMPPGAVGNFFEWGGDYWLVRAGIAVQTQFAMTLKGFFPEQQETWQLPPSPWAALFEAENGRRPQRKFRLVEDVDTARRAWCGLPFASRLQLLSRRFDEESERFEQLATTDMHRRAAYLMAQRRSEEAFVRYHLGCAAQGRPCRMVDAAAPASDDPPAAVDLLYAQAHVADQNRALASAVAAVPPGESAVLRVDAIHLPDLEHRSLQITGLLTHLRRMGYAITHVR